MYIKCHKYFNEYFGSLKIIYNALYVLHNKKTRNAIVAIINIS